MAKPIASSGLQQLKQDIKAKTPKPCYIFWGEETYLMHYYCEQLQKKLIDPMTEAFNYHKLNQENFSMEALVSSVENLPMMAERTMVQVEELDFFKLPEGDKEKLAGLLSDLPDYCCLVFTFETVAYKPDKRQKKLWEAIEKNVQTVEFARQSQKDLIAWVSRHFLSNKKSISSDLCAYLIEITGGTMTALSGEIDKISAFCPGDEITKSCIDAVTEPVLDAVVFQMTDAMGAGNFALALEKLQTLLKMQQEPIVILGAVSSQLRRISAARVLIDSGKGAEELMKLTGLKDYPARKTMSMAGRFSANFCAKAAALCVETDYKLKTSFDDGERLLELLVLQLAQEVRHG